MSGPQPGPESGSRWATASDLLVLHAVRLAGFTQEAGIEERTGLAPPAVRSGLDALQDRGFVERFSFADTAGWILTEAGQHRDAELLLEEVARSGTEPVLERTLTGFDDLNTRFVRVVSEWQLTSLGAAGGARAADDVDAATGLHEKGARVVGELLEIQPLLEDRTAELVARLPRFGRYPSQFRAALRRAREGDHRWIAGVGILSCHVVWAELHQDLLSCLGVDRSGSPGTS